MMAIGELDFEPDRTLIVGELSLEGYIRRSHGVLAILSQASKLGFTSAFIPEENADEARFVDDISVYTFKSLTEVVDHIMHKSRKTPLLPYDPLTHMHQHRIHEYDISHIKGNNLAKRALEIAVSGQHNIVLYGPPGTGKTALARCVPSISPHLDYTHSREVTSIYSAARIPVSGLMIEPPFRTPHHTASAISILGGGPDLRPGEVTLAHRGTLFLDEMPEFGQKTLDGLRQPIEDRHITISRARGTVTFPSQCMILGSMNPCPCGRGTKHGCTCTAYEISRYAERISGPIRDRIDMWIEIADVDYDKISSTDTDTETSDIVRQRICSARNIQLTRKTFNSELSSHYISTKIKLTEDARLILKKSAEKYMLSGRAYYAIIKVAQTIADLAGRDSIERDHILEALSYRLPKRFFAPRISK
jgi:magnesium chelatase family protein